MKFNFLSTKVLGAIKNPTSFWLESWRPFALLLLFGIIIYGQTLFFDFTYLDDNALILDNAQILSKASLPDIFSNDVFFSNHKYYYRPMLTTSLWVDFKLMEALPFWYHFSNIIYHILAVCLLFIFLQRLRIRRALAWWTSVIFLIHPVLVAAVAWVPGRNDSILTIFVLASWLCLENFLRQENWRGWLGHAIFFVLALFTKETAVFLPVLILLYLSLFRNYNFLAIIKYVLRGGSRDEEFDAVQTPVADYNLSGEDESFSSEVQTPAFKSGAALTSAVLKAQTRILIILLSTWLTALIVWFLPRSIVLEGTSFNFFNLFWSLLKSFPAVFLYIGKIIMPLNLSVFPTLVDSNWGAGLGVLILLITVFVRWSPRPRRNYIIFGVTWFLLFLLPSFINPDINSPLGFFEHRLYLPLIGFMLIILELEFIKNLDFKKFKTRLILGIVILILILLNLNYSQAFSDRLSFWNSAANTAPHSAFVQSNLGVMDYLSGDLNKAVIQYKKALALNNKEPMVHNNLGVVYMNLKKYPEAEKEYNLELAYNPNYDKALFNASYLYYLEKRYLEAAYYWQATLVVNPSYFQAYQYLLLLRNKIE